MAVSGRVEFDARGRAGVMGQPVFDTGPATAFVAVPLVRETRRTFDILGRPVRTATPDGGVTTIAYGFGTLDGVTRLQKRVTDANGKSKVHFISVREEILGIQETNTLGGAPRTLLTEYAYNPLSELVAVLDAKENLTKGTYDTTGELISLESPDNGRTEYLYDRSGNLGAKETGNLRAAGNLVRYQYRFNRLEGIDYPNSVDITITYGDRGLPSTAPGASFSAPTNRGPRSSSTESSARWCAATRTSPRRPATPASRPACCTRSTASNGRCRSRIPTARWCDTTMTTAATSRR